MKIPISIFLLFLFFLPQKDISAQFNLNQHCLEKPQNAETIRYLSNERDHEFKRQVFIESFLQAQPNSPVPNVVSDAALSSALIYIDLTTNNGEDITGQALDKFLQETTAEMMDVYDDSLKRGKVFEENEIADLTSDVLKEAGLKKIGTALRLGNKAQAVLGEQFFGNKKRLNPDYSPSFERRAV